MTLRAASRSRVGGRAGVDLAGERRDADVHVVGDRVEEGVGGGLWRPRSGRRCMELLVSMASMVVRLILLVESAGGRRSTRRPCRRW